MNVSKELLSEVLKKELERHDSAFVEVTDVGISNNVVHVNYKNTHGFIHLFIINIYELAHKCKEWAFNNNMMFDIRWHTNVNPFRISVMTYGKDSQFFVGGTEPEAVFLATQWLLDNKDKQ